jgi:hypothetical protein
MRYTPQEVLQILLNMDMSSSQARICEIETSKCQGYELREVNVEDLNPGYTDDEKLESYINLTSEPPPILLDHRGQIMDGFHRVKAQKAKKLPTIMAFVPVGERID